MKKSPNRLIHSTSPYLLQHAYNPVDWNEWGTEALERAKAEDKPILVSIGYSACHWCHVMERESFEVDAIAETMNKYFICIKVDREERPDIDQIYMEAVQAMGTNGGWPLNVFLNPSGLPFYGGTYFPPQNWKRLLQHIQQVFKERRNDVETTASDIHRSIQVNDTDRFANGSPTTAFTQEDLTSIFKILQSRFDKTWGGLERAPKFVMPTLWHFLLRYFYSHREKQALDMVNLTVTKMSEAGLYDQVGGGFARYSVDAEWFAPHFEKMLYDNAQLLSLYSEAFAVTKAPLYLKIVADTISWIKREMTSPDGALYSALDADSEGVEGKFYTWERKDWDDALGSDAEEAAGYFDVTPSGNWEHGRSILHRKSDQSLSHPDLIQQKLMNARSKRIRPGLDDKILTAWNAMTIRGLTDAYCVFGNKDYLQAAIGIIKFLEKNLAGNQVFRSYKGRVSTTEGFLDDHAFLIQAYVGLYQVTFEESYLLKAQHWCEYTLSNFLDETDGYFHFTSKSAEPLIARKKELFDNVIPGSNSVMARNLFELGHLLDLEPWIDRARTMASKLKSIALSEPGYSSNWAILASGMVMDITQVVIVGPRLEDVRQELAKYFLPYTVLMGAKVTSSLPMFEGRESADGKTRVYVCFKKTCGLPVETANEALEQIRNFYFGRNVSAK